MASPSNLVLNPSVLIDTDLPEQVNVQADDIFERPGFTGKELFTQSGSDLPASAWKGGAVQGNGYIGKSFEGNGTSAYIEGLTQPASDVLGGYFRAYFNSFSNYGTLFQHYDEVADKEKLAFRIQADGTLRLNYADTVGVYSYVTNSPVSSGQWLSVGFLYQKNQVPKIYVNGTAVLITQLSFNPAGYATADTKIIYGASLTSGPTNPFRYLDGRLNNAYLVDNVSLDSDIDKYANDPSVSLQFVGNITPSSFISENEMEVTIPVSAPIGNLSLAIANDTGSGFTTLVINGAVPLAINEFQDPSNGDVIFSAGIGETIALIGTGFDEPSLLFNGNEVPIESWTPTTITFVVPQLPSYMTYNVTVSVNPVSNPLGFTVLPSGLGPQPSPQSFTQIQSYRSQVLSRMMEQYKASKLSELVGGISDFADDIETALFELRDLFWLETAEGVQLDVIGLIFDVSRQGLNDSDYRVAIKARSSTRFSGTPEDIISILISFFGASSVIYENGYNYGVPADYTVTTDATITDEQFDVISVAGVKGNLIVPNLSYLTFLNGDPIRYLGGGYILLLGG
jgi:hypothetical protein